MSHISTSFYAVTAPKFFLPPYDASEPSCIILSLYIGICCHCLFMCGCWCCDGSPLGVLSVVNHICKCATMVLTIHVCTSVQVPIAHAVEQ